MTFDEDSQRTFVRLLPRTPTPLLLQNIAWRKDFIECPEDFPARPEDRSLWQQQIEWMTQELGHRDVTC